MDVTWIRVAVGLPDHPKSFVLSQEIKEPNAWAYIVRIWMWCGLYAQDGRISALLAPAAEKFAGWSRKPGFLFAAAEKAGFLDRDDALPGWICHHWDTQQGAPIEKAKKDAARKRAFREASRLAREKNDAGADSPRTVQGQETDTGEDGDVDRSRDGAGTGRDVTGRDVTGRDVTGRTTLIVEEEAPRPPPKNFPRLVEKPDKPEEQWGFPEFEQWFQHKRQKASLIPERFINHRKGSSWWSEVMMTPGMGVQRLKRAVYLFSEDEHWKSEGLPLAAFMSQWADYASKEAVSVRAG